MKEKFSKVAVVVGSSFFVVAFGFGLALINRIGYGGDNQNQVFVQEDFRLPQVVDYVSSNGYSFSYDEGIWEVAEQDTDLDIKLQHINSGDTLTVVSTPIDSETENIQPIDFGQEDKESLENVADSLEIKSSEIVEFQNAQFYKLDYSIKLFDYSEFSNSVRYITSAEENVIKFIATYSDDEVKADIEDLVDSFLLF